MPVARIDEKTASAAPENQEVQYSCLKSDIVAEDLKSESSRRETQHEVLVPTGELLKAFEMSPSIPNIPRSTNGNEKKNGSTFWRFGSRKKKTA
jgi:hypothetical protein